MTWIKLDNNSPRHPKIAALTDKAFRWWFNGLCFASEFLTDGLLPPTFWKQAPKTARAELTKGGIWIWKDPNFQIHDYLKYQQSREAVESERRRNRDRRKTDRGTTDRRTAVPPDDLDGGRTEEKPRPDTEKEIRDQIPEKDPNTHTARANGHGRGANAPGALHRDHLYHALCSAPKRRVCLTDKTASELATKWGGHPDEISPVLQEFLDGLEAQIGDGSKGDYLWLLQHFEAFMHSKGRDPIPAPKPPKVNGKESVIDQMDKWGRE